MQINIHNKTQVPRPTYVHVYSCHRPNSFVTSSPTPPHPTPLRPLECRPEVTSAIQAEQSKGTSTLPSYHFSYSREAVFLLTNFCTPKAHVSVSHTPSLSPTPPVTCTYCYPPVTLLSPAPTGILLLSPAPTSLLLSSSCHPLVTSGGPSVLTNSFCSSHFGVASCCLQDGGSTCCRRKYVCCSHGNTHLLHSGTGCGGTVVQGNPTSVTHSTSLPKAYIISYMHTCTSAV